MSTKEDIFTYVMNTPGNTNPAVLESLLNNLEDSGESIPPHNIVNITNNSSGTPVISGSGLITADGIMGVQDFPTYIPSGDSKMFLYNGFTGGRYMSRFIISAKTDLYSITVNNTPLTYNDKDSVYVFSQTSETGPITGQIYNVVITDKE